MAGEFIGTVGDVSNLEGLFQGRFLKGRREPRVAFVGRSNVGKSTLINKLLGARVAQTSNQPGKTRAIHFYLWPEARRIVADLPGYGYARAAKTERERWARFIGAYLQEDSGLDRALVLLDARQGPTDLDEEALRFLRAGRVPVTLVFTKADTLKNHSQRVLRKREASEAVVRLGFNPRSAHWVSSRGGDGMKRLEADLKGALREESAE